MVATAGTRWTIEAHISSTPSSQQSGAPKAYIGGSHFAKWWTTQATLYSALHCKLISSLNNTWTSQSPNDSLQVNVPIQFGSQAAFPPQALTPNLLWTHHALLFLVTATTDHNRVWHLVNILTWMNIQISSWSQQQRTIIYCNLSVLLQQCNVSHPHSY